jgi:hypothetical protein
VLVGPLVEDGLRKEREALPALKTVNVNLEDGLRKKREALPALKTVNVNLEDPSKTIL